MWPRKGTPIDWTVLFSPTEAAMKERTKLCTGKLQTWATTWAFTVKKALRSLSLSFFLKISPLHPFSLTSLILTARSSHQQRLSLSLSLILLQQTIHFSLSNMNVFYSLSLFHMNAHLFLSLLKAAGVVAGGAAVLLQQQNGYLHVLCVKTFCIGIKLFCSTVVLF